MSSFDATTMMCCKFIVNKITFELKEQNLVIRPIKTVHTNLFAKNHKLHKFAATNRNFAKIDYFRHASSCNCTSISISNKIGWADQSKPCTQI